MLTRLKVSGFKNLVDVDIRFGSFTCIAGANGVGKSNLFDAIQFLSALAGDRSLNEAALAIRDESGNTGDIRSLFHRVGNSYAKQMSFEAEMIIPNEAIDELGQTAQATITFLKYSLTLTYRNDERLGSLGSLAIEEEKLERIRLSDASDYLLFPHKANTWRKSALQGRRSPPFISTEEDKDGNRVVKLHQDGSSGRALSRLADKLPRTVLSSTYAAESPTALITKQEMRSWQLLQLEPSALRQPDAFTASTSLDSNGSHLASTLYYLARHQENLSDDQNMTGTEERIYAEVANRLAELIDDVKQIWIDRDNRRELLTLMVENYDGTSHPARSLSDGTLRFLALVVFELDQKAKGVLCLEEPENGIHPERIPKILQLLQDIATDTDEEVGTDNPLRQVIINTHSPTVVQQVPDDSLVVAELQEMVKEGDRFKQVQFGCLPDTWRQTKADDSENIHVIAKGTLLAYLNPVPQPAHHEITEPKRRRVIDRPDLTPLIPGLAEQLP